MSVQIDPPRRYCIQDFAAVLRFEKYAIATAYHGRRWVSALVREWVPQMEFGIGHCV
jgi:hypothetical protein